MSMQLKAIKLRLYPNAEQLSQLPQLFGNARFVYNKFTRYQRIAYRNHLKFLNESKMKRFLAQLKLKYEFLRFSDSTSLQAAVENVARAYDNYFHHRANLPVLKKRKWNQKYTGKVTSNNNRFVSKHYFKLAKFKAPFRISGCSIPHGRIRRVIVEQASSGKYFLTLLCECAIEPKPKNYLTIGLDAGLRNNQILSNGLKTKALRFNDLEKRLKQAQRVFNHRSRQAKLLVEFEENQNKSALVKKTIVPWYFRPNVVKARQHVARLYAKIRNKRYDYLQKLSTMIVTKYDVIYLEKLNVRNMLKNHKLAHAISNQGWGMFREMLKYKAKWYGKEVRLVNPRNTTQTCSDCQYICNHHDSTFIERGVEAWECPKCHQHHDRDINAAINITHAEPIEIIKY